MIRLAWTYLWSRPLSSLLNLLLLGLGLASITFLQLAGTQLQRGFERDLQGIDLVVGAKGSPMQLILAGVFHLDVPPGNIKLDEARTLAAHPLVAKWIPLSLGDSYRGFRIVGTERTYPEHYAMGLAQGAWWAQPMEAVIGAEVASRTGLTLGAQFAGAHGLAGGSAHAEHPYRVVGVMAPCGCVQDRLILTSTESVWEAHETHETHEEHAHASSPVASKGGHSVHAAEPPREITIALVQYRSPLAAASLPRWVNASTGMQAAAPAVEVSRLLRMVGVGSEVLRVAAWVLLATASLGVFVTLWSALRERRADMALLRLLGAPAHRVALVLLAEAVWLAVLASALGLVVGHALAQWAGAELQAQGAIGFTGWIWLPQEWLIPVAAIGLATAASVLPMIAAYRVTPAQALVAR